MKILVTGAGRGIGKATAELFHSKGFEVYSNYQKNLPSVGIPIQADVSDLKQVKYMFSKIGNIDILVNNAGIALNGLFQDIPEEQIKNLFNVNVFGTFNCTKLALPHMINKKFGRIINISSIWGEVGGSYEVHYSSSKAAIIGFTKALAKEVAPCGITVNCVSPGVIDTDMTSGYDVDVPIGRFGKPAEVAEAVYFLANSEYTTGHILSVNGAFS
jgi:3-oxoacyl-[acyl-carrier protein] reductase